MDSFSLFSFITVSIPEEFIMALFAWVMLGKRGTVKFLNVIIAGFVTAISFIALQVFLYPNLTLFGVLQVVAFTLIIYFAYELNYIEAIVGSLLTTIVVAVIQAAVVTSGLSISGHTWEDLNRIEALKSIFVIPEVILIGMVSLIFIKINIRIFNFKTKKLSEVYKNSKLRFLILQLLFAFLIILINYRMFLFRPDSLKTDFDNAMLIINFSVIIAFTALIIGSAFRVSVNLEREEAQRRELYGREIINSLDYLSTLLNQSRYAEAQDLLFSIRDQVGIGLVPQEQPNEKVSS